MSDTEEERIEKQLKLVVLGEENVGKTSLVKRFCHDDFLRTYVPTIGADFYRKRIVLKTGNSDLIARMTDVSGSELNGHMLATYLFKVHIVVLVYDISNKDSFDSLIQWLRKIDLIMVGNTDARSVPIVVVGNKCDLEHKRAVARAVTDSFVHDNKLYNYHVSAKNGENVDATFADIIARYLNLPPDSLEVGRQPPVIRAELTAVTPPKSSGKSKPHTLGKVHRVKKESQACAIQ